MVHMKKYSEVELFDAVNSSLSEEEINSALISLSKVSQHLLRNEVVNKKTRPSKTIKCTSVVREIDEICLHATNFNDTSRVNIDLSPISNILSKINNNEVTRDNYPIIYSEIKTINRYTNTFPLIFAFTMGKFIFSIQKDITKREISRQLRVDEKTIRNYLKVYEILYKYPLLLLANISLSKFLEFYSEIEIYINENLHIKENLRKCLNIVHLFDFELNLK